MRIWQQDSFQQDAEILFHEKILIGLLVLHDYCDFLKNLLIRFISLHFILYWYTIVIAKAQTINTKLALWKTPSNLHRVINLFKVSERSLMHIRNTQRWYFPTLPPSAIHGRWFLSRLALLVSGGLYSQGRIIKASTSFLLGKGKALKGNFEQSEWTQKWLLWCNDFVSVQLR